jgi:hypothetical protein
LCTIHAINNALQRKIVNVADADEALRERFDNINLKLALKRKPLIDFDSYYHSESDMGFSIDLFREKLLKFNLFLHLRTIPLPKSIYSRGSWVVLGRYPRFNHALAIRNGYVIESLSKEKPYKLKDFGFPRNFEPFLFFEISSESPIKQESSVIEID